MKRIKIKVYGLVQGVFFRYTTRRVARKLGLTGFVKKGVLVHCIYVPIDAVIGYPVACIYSGCTSGVGMW